MMPRQQHKLFIQLYAERLVGSFLIVENIYSVAVGSVTDFFFSRETSFTFCERKFLMRRSILKSFI
jgi:hypothetical protein